jgi:hypothetical protein
MAPAPALAPAKKLQLGVQFWLAFWSLAIISLTALPVRASAVALLQVTRQQEEVGFKLSFEDMIILFRTYPSTWKSLIVPALLDFRGQKRFLLKRWYAGRYPGSQIGGAATCSSESSLAS